MRRTILLCITLAMMATMAARGLTIKMRSDATEREKYAAEYLQKKLAGHAFDGYTVTFKLRSNTGHITPAPEGYSIMKHAGRRITIEGNDPSGVIYGAVELAERLLNNRLTTGQID